MRDYILSCSSTVDLTRKQLLDRDIRYVCFHLILDGQDIFDDMGQTISPEELYQSMLSGAEIQTAQVPLHEYLEYFEELLTEGTDILHVDFSSGLSGSYNTACFAAKELEKTHPDQKIRVVDSLAASSGYGLIMETLADMRDSGSDLDTLCHWLEQNKLRMHHWFFSSDLTFYIKGGRISKTAGMVGTVLNICPLLNMDCHGTLRLREKLRGKKKVIQRIVEMMELYAENGIDYNKKCYICHSNCPDDAEAAAALIEQKFPYLDGYVKIYPIGAVIGSHTGPGTLALFFWGEERMD